MSQKTKEPIDFAAGMKELEAITSWFESDEIDLNQGLVKFERGMEVAAELKAYLGTVENRVEKIKQKFDGKLDRSDDTPEPDRQIDLPELPF